MIELGGQLSLREKQKTLHNVFNTVDYKNSALMVHSILGIINMFGPE